MRVLEVCRVGSWVALSVVFSGLWMGNPAVGAPVTVPTSLQAGKQYRLVFVTSTVHNALSDDISNYNSIVDLLGDTAIASDWKVIGSTETVDAIDNTATPIATSGVSIWRMDGEQVVADYADLWDGTITNRINKGIDGLTITGWKDEKVWTGTNEFGVKDDIYLGFISPIDQNIYGHKGSMAAKDRRWTRFQEFKDANELNHLYGMSGVLTVAAAAVPEPSSAILLGVGVICVGWSRFRPKRRQASSTV